MEFVAKIGTPIGDLVAKATEDGICELKFIKPDEVVNENKKIYFKSLKDQIDEYFFGKRREFDVPLDIQGTEFQQKTWKALQEIQFGETLSYQEQAEIIGNSKAVRAVANANRMNKLAIIIPCHRVIGKDGSLTGYAGGLDKKRYLLEHEGTSTSHFD